MAEPSAKRLTVALGLGSAVVALVLIAFRQPWPAIAFCVATFVFAEWLIFRPGGLWSRLTSKGPR